MKTPLDDHGQPLNTAFNYKRRVERDISEMLGLAKGIISDGVINADEAEFLGAWGLAHPEALAQWPVDLVFSRLIQILADGKVDEAERQDLHELLSQLIGGATSILLGWQGSTELPLDRPAPLVCYGPAEVFVFTGKFAYGTRAHCHTEITARASTCDENITSRTTFLVLGTFGSTDWRQTSYGRKIEKAVNLRAVGYPIRIVGEDHWANSLAKLKRLEVAREIPEAPF